MKRVSKLLVAGILSLTTLGISETFAGGNLGVDFDQGVNPSAVLQRARENLKKIAPKSKTGADEQGLRNPSLGDFEIRKLVPGPITQNVISAVRIGSKKTRYVTPCEKIPPYGIVSQNPQECSGAFEDTCEDAKVNATSFKSLPQIIRELIPLKEAKCAEQREAGRLEDEHGPQSNVERSATTLGNIWGPLYPLYRDSEEYQEARGLVPILQRYPESVSGELLSEWPPIVRERCSLLSLTRGLDCQDERLFDRREWLRGWDKVMSDRKDLLQADYDRLRPICEAPRPPGQPWPVECSQFNNCVDSHNAENKRRNAAWDVFKRDLEALRQKYLPTLDRFEAGTKIQKEWATRAKKKMEDAGNVVTVHTHDNRIQNAPRIVDETLIHVTREIGSKMVAIVADRMNRTVGRDHTFGLEFAAKKAREYLNSYIGDGMADPQSWDFGSVGEYRLDVEITGKYPYEGVR